MPQHPGTPLDLEAWEEQIRAALVRLTEKSPASDIQLSDGSAEISIGDKPPMLLEDVAAQTIASPEQFRFTISARSNLWEQLRVEGSVSPESLESQLDVGLQQISIKETLVLIAPQIAEGVKPGKASFDIRMSSVGLRRMKAAIDGSVGPFVFAGHGGTATVEAKRLRGGITYEGKVFQVNVQLELGSPRLQASGELKIQPGSLSASIKVRDVDIAEVNQMALRLVDDTEPAKRIMRYISAGTIPEVNFHSAGRSLAEMISSQNIAVAASMRDCRILIPGYDLEFKNVGGSLRIANGVLEASERHSESWKGEGVERPAKAWA